MYCSRCLRRRRPGLLRNHRVGKNALSLGSVQPDVVIRLIRRNSIAELLREQIGQIRTAHVPCERIGLTRQISRAVRQRGNGNQSRIDALALPGSLIIAKVEDLFFLIGPPIVPPN